MAKILVCADGFFRNFSPLGLEPYIESFINVLVRHGNQVMPFIGRDYAKTKKLKEKYQKWKAVKEAVDFKPDLIFSFNNLIEEKFLSKTDCPLYIIGSDTPVYWHKLKLIKRFNERCHALYFNKEYSAFLTENLGIPPQRQLLIPYTTEIVPQPNVSPQFDISFIGNFYNPDTSIAKIIWRSQHTADTEDFKQDLLELINLTGQKASAEILPKADAFIKRYHMKETPAKLTSNLFQILTSSKRLQILNQLCDLNLHLFAYKDNLLCVENNFEIFKCCHTAPCYSLQDNQFVYNASKISLNLPHAQTKTGFSWRVCDICASNAMLLANETEDVNKLFRNTIPTYKDERDIRDKCLYFLKNTKERADIVGECHRIIDKAHRFEHLFREIENFANVKLLNLNTKGVLQNTTPVQKRQEQYLLATASNKTKVSK